MATFKEAEKARISLKMKLSNYSWYKNSLISVSNDGYYVKIVVNSLNDAVKKVIPVIVDSVSIRTELS